MRQIGTLENEKDAKRFVDYLTTQGISAVAESDQPTEWSIWVREEDRVSETRDQFSQFRENPTHPRYVGVEREAASVRQQHQAAARRIRKKSVDMRSQWQAPLARRAPATVLLIAISVGVYLLASTSSAGIVDALQFSSPPTARGGAAAASPWYSISRGEVWRLVTPIFIHYGILHLVFNMFVLHVFGTAIEMREGTPFFGLAVLVTAIFSNVLQAVVVDVLFGGMSGVCYGLFGYVWVRSRLDMRSGYFVSRELVLMLMFWLVLGFVASSSDVMNLHFANWAHLGGLAAGAAIGSVKSR